MRYIGSKTSTIEQAYNLIVERVPAGTFCDPFGGIGVVGAFFKMKGFTVWSGDILTFTHYFQITRIELDHTPSFSQLCEINNFNSLSDVVEVLNNESVTNGWLVREYSEKRQFFTRENAMRIEGCRALILSWHHKKWINFYEKAILLASLINSMDKIANTAGTYYAYLKNWYRKAIKPFRFELLSHIPGKCGCRSFLEDATSLVSRRDFDIIYLDPPYNERSYAHYYHLPESLALGQDPLVHGKSGIPNDMRIVSDFNRPQKAEKALLKLLEHARFKLLAVQYSDKGFINRKYIKDILSQFGKVEEFILRSTGYVSRREPRTSEHRLYLVFNG
jgi:adenine-specific DNA-methyltransferase